MKPAQRFRFPEELADTAARSRQYGESSRTTALPRSGLPNNFEEEFLSRARVTALPEPPREIDHTVAGETDFLAEIAKRGGESEEWVRSFEKWTQGVEKTVAEPTEWLREYGQMEKTAAREFAARNTQTQMIRQNSDFQRFADHLLSNKSEEEFKAEIQSTWRFEDLRNDLTYEIGDVNEAGLVQYLKLLAIENSPEPKEIELRGTNDPQTILWFLTGSNGLRNVLRKEQRDLDRRVLFILEGNPQAYREMLVDTAGQFDPAARNKTNDELVTELYEDSAAWRKILWAMSARIDGDRRIHEFMQDATSEDLALLAGRFNIPLFLGDGSLKSYDDLITDMLSDPAASEYLYDLYTDWEIKNDTLTKIKLFFQNENNYSMSQLKLLAKGYGINVLTNKTKNELVADLLEKTPALEDLTDMINLPEGEWIVEKNFWHNKTPRTVNLRNGSRFVWYEDGNLEESGHYIGGKKEGEFVYGRPNGSLFSVENYKNDVLDGKFRTFDSENRVESDGEYLNGQREGTWTFYERNGDFSTAEYRNGEEIPQENASSKAEILVSPEYQNLIQRIVDKDLEKELIDEFFNAEDLYDFMVALKKLGITDRGGEDAIYSYLTLLAIDSDATIELSDPVEVFEYLKNNSRALKFVPLVNRVMQMPEWVVRKEKIEEEIRASPEFKRFEEKTRTIPEFSLGMILHGMLSDIDLSTQEKNAGLDLYALRNIHTEEDFQHYLSLSDLRDKGAAAFLFNYTWRTSFNEPENIPGRSGVKKELSVRESRNFWKKYQEALKNPKLFATLEVPSQGSVIYAPSDFDALEVFDDLEAGKKSKYLPSKKTRNVEKVVTQLRELYYRPLPEKSLL